MKHKNLEIMRRHHINVPRFIVLKKIEDFTPIASFVLEDNKKYAIRSSCGIEDTEKQSMAGKFKTILNVEKHNIRKELPSVFESMANETNNENCVIVQEMIDADFSGVIFTANPVLGLLNETVIVVGKGLGDNVVNDSINTTTYFHNQDDGIYYYELSEGSPLLEETVLIDIINNAEKIKNIFNKQMDIEFAIKDNVIYILQARPITTLENNKTIILDNSNIVESYPDVSLPLTQSFVKDIYHEVFHRCVERITKDNYQAYKMNDILKDMVECANWRIYYQIDNWYSFLRLMPFSNKIISTWQEMLGVNNKFVLDNIEKIPFKIKFRVLLSFIYYLFATPKLMEQLNKDFDEDYATFRQQISQATEIKSLLEVHRMIKYTILADWDITLINDMYTFVYTSLAGKRNRMLLADIKDLESIKPLQSLEALIEIAKDIGINSNEYKSAKEIHIELYGDRCLEELKLETKTYRTHPELLDNYINENINKQNDADDYLKPSCSFKCSNYFARKAKVGIKNREISRLNRSKIFGISREIFIKIGNILCNENKLENVEDVFYLYINELDKADIDFKKLVNERKNKEKEMRNVPAYNRLVFDGKIKDRISGTTNTSILNDNKELKGTPTSVGIVEGEVLIIDEPNDSIDTTDKIIVTKSTDPGWIFLIQKASGIIAEKGSLLSHTAIISRELKKPAIVNVKDCMSILHNGDRVLLNSQTGKIKIID